MNEQAEAQLVANRAIADRAYVAEVAKLCASRRQTGHPLEPLYMTACFFTEDAGLWEYARRRLDEVRAECR
jgi:hypothetical protein